MRPTFDRRLWILLFWYIIFLQCIVTRNQNVISVQQKYSKDSKIQQNIGQNALESVDNTFNFHDKHRTQNKIEKVIKTKTTPSIPRKISKKNNTISVKNSTLSNLDNTKTSPSNDNISNVFLHCANNCKNKKNIKQNISTKKLNNLPKSTKSTKSTLQITSPSSLPFQIYDSHTKNQNISLLSSSVTSSTLDSVAKSSSKQKQQQQQQHHNNKHKNSKKHNNKLKYTNNNKHHQKDEKHQKNKKQPQRKQHQQQKQQQQIQHQKHKSHHLNVENENSGNNRNHQKLKQHFKQQQQKRRYNRKLHNTENLTTSNVIASQKYNSTIHHVSIIEKLPVNHKRNVKQQNNHNNNNSKSNNHTKLSSSSSSSEKSSLTTLPDNKVNHHHSSTETENNKKKKKSNNKKSNNSNNGNNSKNNKNNNKNFVQNHSNKMRLHDISISNDKNHSMIHQDIKNASSKSKNHHNNNKNNYSNNNNNNKGKVKVHPNNQNKNDNKQHKGKNHQHHCNQHQLHSQQENPNQAKTTVLPRVLITNSTLTKQTVKATKLNTKNKNKKEKEEVIKSKVPELLITTEIAIPSHLQSSILSNIVPSDIQISIANNTLDIFQTFATKTTIPTITATTNSIEFDHQDNIEKHRKLYDEKITSSDEYITGTIGTTTTNSIPKVNTNVEKTLLKTDIEKVDEEVKNFSKLEEYKNNTIITARRHVNSSLDAQLNDKPKNQQFAMISNEKYDDVDVVKTENYDDDDDDVDTRKSSSLPIIDKNNNDDNNSVNITRYPISRTDYMHQVQSTTENMHVKDGKIEDFNDKDNKINKMNQKQFELLKNQQKLSENNDDDKDEQTLNKLKKIDLSVGLMIDLAILTPTTTSIPDTLINVTTIAKENNLKNKRFKRNIEEKYDNITDITINIDNVDSYNDDDTNGSNIIMPNITTISSSDINTSDISYNNSLIKESINSNIDSYSSSSSYSLLPHSSSNLYLNNSSISISLPTISSSDLSSYFSINSSIPTNVTSQILKGTTRYNEIEMISSVTTATTSNAITTATTTTTTNDNSNKKITNNKTKITKNEDILPSSIQNSQNSYIIKKNNSYNDSSSNSKNFNINNKNILPSPPLIHKQQTDVSNINSSLDMNNINNSNNEDNNKDNYNYNNYNINYKLNSFNQKQTNVNNKLNNKNINEEFSHSNNYNDNINNKNKNLLNKKILNNNNNEGNKNNNNNNINSKNIINNDNNNNNNKLVIKKLISPKRKKIHEPIVIIDDNGEEFDSGISSVISDSDSNSFINNNNDNLKINKFSNNKIKYNNKNGGGDGNNNYNNKNNNNNGDIENPDYQHDEPLVLPLRPIMHDEEMSVVYADQHSEVKLACEVDMDIKSNKWYRNGQQISVMDRTSRVTDYRFIRESNGVLTINNVMLEDNGKWECEAWNDRNLKENARPVKLVVLDRPKPPYLLIDSRRLDAGNIFVPVKENSELSLACVSEGGNPKPTLTWEVLLSPGVDRHAQKVAAEVLELEEIKLDKDAEPYKMNSGAKSEARLPAVYRAHHNARILCVMEHPTLKSRLNASILLDVQYTPSFAISRTPGFGYPLREGMEVSLKCDVDSNPASTPRWQKDDGDPPVPQSGDGFLNFTSIRREHSGWYKCTSRHLNFQYSSIGYYLSVRYDSVDVTSEPDDQEVSVAASHNPNKGQLEVQLGGAVTLQCPQGSLGCWSHLDPVTARLRGLGNGLSTPTGQFSLKDVVYQDAGTYKCIGQSTTNKKKLEVLQTVGLTVKGHPTVVARDANPIAYPGSPLHLSVEFCANPPAHAARWLHDDRVYTPGNQYGQSVLAYGVTDLPTPFCKEARLTYIAMHEKVKRTFYFIVSSPGGVAEAIFKVNFTLRYRQMSNAIDDEEEELSEPEEIHFPVFGSSSNNLVSTMFDSLNSLHRNNFRINLTSIFKLILQLCIILLCISMDVFL